MKKLITIGLSFLSLTVGAQNFKSFSFLTAQSIGITNGSGFTNLAQYFGQNQAFTTNAGGFTYTNDTGTWVTDFIANTNTGITVLSNGVIYITNDFGQVARDVLFHSDEIGNVSTNYNISCAFGEAGTNRSLTNFFAVFAPLVKGGTAQGGPIVGVIPPILGNGGVGTIIDVTNAFTLTFTGQKGTNSVSVQQLPSTLSLTGYKGLRLLYVYETNLLTAVNIFDLSLNTYQP